MAAMHIEDRHIRVCDAADAEPEQGQQADHQSAYERLLRRFGGRQSDLVRAVGRDQSTVSKWKSRGVPIEAAPAIAEAAARSGVALTLHEVVDWIMADRRQAV